MSDDELRKLSDAPLDELMAERVRRGAQAVLAEERALLGHPWRRRAIRAWSDRIVPALVAAACVIYLVWAVRFTSALYQ